MNTEVIIFISIVCWIGLLFRVIDQNNK